VTRALSQQFLNSTVRLLSAAIHDEVRAKPAPSWREFELRRELISCILGSQVRHEIAAGLASQLELAGLLDDCWWGRTPFPEFGGHVLEVLSGRHWKAHRFPNNSAAHLVKVRDALSETPLLSRIFCGERACVLREHLVETIAGVGPKQASMFLRNIGYSYELAVLDTHVLRFMLVQELLPADDYRMVYASDYERIESVLSEYAHGVGYPVGLVDLAIWSTMQAAKDLGL